MKIAQIRDVIRTAAWVRRDITGGTAEETKRQDVGGVLAVQIAKLKALVIPERFPAERLARDEQIGFCEDVVARWLKSRESVAKPVAPEQCAITCDFETESPVPLTLEEFLAPKADAPKLYTRGNGGPILKVIDGGKK